MKPLQLYILRCVIVLIMMAAQCVIAPIAHAVVVEDLYSVEFPVPDQSRKVRSAVFTKGLEEVLIRVSGNRAVVKQLKTGSASSYVQQFSYAENEPEQELSESSIDTVAAPVEGFVLNVQYNAGKIISLLRNNDLAVWGEHRSEAVVWLAVRDGVNRYVLTNSDDSLLKQSVETSSVRRGLPVVWPRNDAQDQKRLRFSDVWAAFELPVKAASERYTRGPAIVGRLSWTGDKWKGDWSLYVENSSSSWSLSGSDYNALIAEAIDLSADEIGKHYAVLERLGTAGAGLLVEINKIDSVTDYRSIQKFLEGLTAVRQTRLVRVDKDNVVFQIDLRGGIDDFTRLVSTDKTLEPVIDSIRPGNDPDQQIVLQYQFQN